MKRNYPTKILINSRALQQAVFDKDLSHRSVSRQVPVNRTTLQKWMSGEIKRVEKGLVQRLADLLGVPPESLQNKPEDHPGELELSRTPHHRNGTGSGSRHRLL